MLGPGRDRVRVRAQVVPLVVLRGGGVQDTAHMLGPRGGETHPPDLHTITHIHTLYLSSNQEGGGRPPTHPPHTHWHWHWHSRSQSQLHSHLHPFHRVALKCEHSTVGQHVLKPLRAAERFVAELAVVRHGHAQHASQHIPREAHLCARAWRGGGKEGERHRHAEHA
eukprot:359047-Chlamydomonas_euryale.AAC.12